MLLSKRFHFSSRNCLNLWYACRFMTVAMELNPDDEDDGRRD